jgi:hypothetical protein
MLVLPSVRTPTGTSPLRPRYRGHGGRSDHDPGPDCGLGFLRVPEWLPERELPASPFSMMNLHRGWRPERKALEVWDRSRRGERLARLGAHELVDRRSRLGGSPWPTTPGKDGDLPEEVPADLLRGTSLAGDRVHPHLVLQQPEHDEEIVVSHPEPTRSYRPAPSTLRVARASPSP